MAAFWSRTTPLMRNIFAADSRLLEPSGAIAWLRSPPRTVAALILGTFLARLVFAASLGLGVDESYMVAAGRKLQLSYFDHPPIAWWIAWGMAHLTGSESAVVVRLPFVALFALTTWLMYRVTSALFDPQAGLWAAVALNLAPVLGVTACTWLALCSKSSAALTLLGAVAFLATEPTSRHWLTRPHPYVAGLVALVVFSPVLLWNAEHGWVSLLFQGARAG